VYRPFKVGVQELDDEPYDQSKVLNANTQVLQQYEAPSTAFLRGFYVLVENAVTGSTETATSTSTGVGVLTENGPYNVLDQVIFTDTNNSEILGPINGWDLYVITKWGGYSFQDDPEANTDLFASTANSTVSAATSGSFIFMLYIPVEIVPRDALGVLPNKSSSTPFKVKLQLAPLATIYANSATIGGTCRVRIFPDSYWEPTRDDGSGNSVANQPPGVNTTQYWNVTQYTINSGAQSPLLQNSTGYPVRHLGFVFSSSNSRATGETNFPDNFKLQLQSNIMLDRPKALWKSKMTRAYGYVKKGETAGQIDNGLYWKPYCDDFYPKPGWETRRGYLRTTDGMRLTAKGTFGAAGTLTVYTNYIGVAKGTSLAQITS
jgi:hypothetical protein